MNFRLAAVMKRSVTLELINRDIVYTRPYIVLLNGEELMRENRNVISIFGLEPDTEYRIAIILAEGGGEEPKWLSFRTAPESVLLDVRAFGALGDGKNDDTACIQAAIEACPKDGTVRIPKGRYLTRPLFLRSGLSLWLDRGAVLLGDPSREHYPRLPGMTERSDGKGGFNLGSWEGDPETSYASLLTGIELRNVDIFGEGTVDGNADRSDWWEEHKTKRGAWRPRTIFLCRCRCIRIQGVLVKNSPSWTIHPYYTDGISLYNVTIWNPPDSPNTDGFDPESCEDVLLLGCCISVGDDCIAVKSGKARMAGERRKASRNFALRNSILERGHGALTIGSEAAAGVYRVEASLCIFSGTDRGLRLKTRRGRGPDCLYDEIYFHDIRMENVPMPFTFNMFYHCDADGHERYVQSQEALPVNAMTPGIGAVRAENIRCSGVDSALLCAYGLPERPIGAILLRGIDAVFLEDPERPKRQVLMMDDFPPMRGMSIYAKNIGSLKLENISIRGAEKEPILQNISDYESRAFILR